MDYLILTINVLLFVRIQLMIENQRELKKRLERKDEIDRKHRNKLRNRKRAPNKPVVVKHTHSREIVRVVPTSSEYMAEQYKRVSKQYNKE